MTDEEFITEAIKILNIRGCNAKVCNAKDTLHLGYYSYMRRFQLVGTAKKILQLEGYSIVEETVKQ